MTSVSIGHIEELKFAEVEESDMTDHQAYGGGSYYSLGEIFLRLVVLNWPCLTVLQRIV